MLALRRITARQLPARFVRMYSNENVGPTNTSNPDEFGKREKSNEDWYVKQHEKENLTKLREEIKRREQELKDLKEKAENQNI